MNAKPQAAGNERMSLRLFAAAALGLLAWEIWAVFVRDSAAMTIRGSHLVRAGQFGAATPVTQMFQMRGNGLTAIDVRVASDPPSTLFVQCELRQTDVPREGEVPAAASWVATLKRVSDADWRRITVPVVSSSHEHVYALSLRLIDAVPLEASPDRSNRPRASIEISTDNVVGGGQLTIGGERQVGSLSIRVVTLDRTAYRRFVAQVEPVVPPVLRNPAVQLAIAVGYQWALLSVVFGLVFGDRGRRAAADGRDERDEGVSGDGRPSVLMVTGAYHPEISSGGLQVQQSARAMRGRAGVRVLTTAVDRSLPRRSDVEGVEVSRVFVNAASLASKLGAAWTMYAELLRLARKSDVVHIHGYSQKNVLATMAAKRARVPIVLSLHTSGFDEPAVIARSGAMARRALGAAGAFVCVSAKLAEACRAAGIPEARIHEVPNGVDLTRFRPATADERAALRQSLNLPLDRPAVLFVGFFSREKQPHVLFDAWLALQARPALVSTLIFVGATRSAYFEVDESLATDMRARAVRAGVADRLRFVDPTQRIDEYYRAADVYALPSSREGMPVALLEAMACGLPVVASRLPGATDVLVDHGRTGLLVTSGDTAAWTDALAGVLADRGHASALGAAARAFVAGRFSADATAAGWLAAYRTVSAAFAGIGQRST